jgi:HEAT repeat protein
MGNDGLLHELMAQDDPIEWFERLAAENDPALHEALREALLHPDREVRIYAAVMLAQEFHDVSALPGLVDALLDWNRQVRSAAAEAVWEIGDMDPAGLIRALHFERGAVRDAIVEALAIVGWFPDDIEAEVTYYIAIRDWHQLVILGSPAVPGLISALSDPDGNVRRGAAWALGEIGDPRAVPYLIDLLEDTSGDMFGIGGRVCDVAAEALVQIGTAEAVGAVRSAFPER